MVDLTTVEMGPVRLDLAPSLGGAIARLDVGGLPVLRPWSGDQSNLFSLASNILVPFSNRVSGGGFDWSGVHHALPQNFDGDPYPIHGDGFQKQWDIDLSGPVPRMTLSAGAIGPWHYQATQDFHLSETGLEINLTLRNTGELTLPFGYGFHPWFPRSSDTRLSFAAQGVWMEDARHLPTNHLSLSDAPNWEFAQPRALPKTLINNAYTGWQRSARIEQGENAVSCTVTAAQLLNTAIVYSSDEQADFFCFEPVSHPVDAFHLPSHPGLKELSPGQTMQTSMTISWSSP